MSKHPSTKPIQLSPALPRTFIDTADFLRKAGLAHMDTFWEKKEVWLQSSNSSDHHPPNSSGHRTSNSSGGQPPGDNGYGLPNETNPHNGPGRAAQSETNEHRAVKKHRTVSTIDHSTPNHTTRKQPIIQEATDGIEAIKRFTLVEERPSKQV